MAFTQNRICPCWAKSNKCRKLKLAALISLTTQQLQETHTSVIGPPINQ